METTLPALIVCQPSDGPSVWNTSSEVWVNVRVDLSG
jgi:hypothetical protein